MTSGTLAMSFGEPVAVPAAFDVCGPLPQGTTVLEASAGTGKTATIAALATRYVAEGVADLASIMLVTFSRAATQELRERVRERLRSAERGLADPRAAREQDRDEVLRLLADVPDGEVAQRRRRLTVALSSFDGATIATTHGFAAQVLAGLGFASDTDLDATLLEGAEDLVDEVVDDLYLRKYAAPGAGVPRMDHATARLVGREALRDPGARLLPEDAPPGSAAHERAGLAQAVRREVDARKRARRLLDYDDLLSRLRDALEHPTRGAAARARLQARYSVVLVDEFQDTDPVQWQVLRSAFHGVATLVLIGDPKQAVYAFRGADLVTYLAAAGSATTMCTLGRNWRSDEGLVAAAHALVGRAPLGDPRVVLRPVEAAHAGSRLHGAPSPAPLRLRLLSRPPDSARPAPVGEVRARIAADVAADVVHLLDSGARLAEPGGEREVGPGDVAVLVRTNRQADLVREALDAAGVPAVLGGGRSVFLTRPARDWLVLLRAVEQPHRPGLVRAAALTPFVSWSAAELDARGDAGLDELGPRLREWRDVWAQRGVAALLQVVSSTSRLAERLLAAPTGERDLTDLRHVGEALHGAAVRDGLGPAALVEELAQRIGDAEGDGLDERSRRLETDADAVQVTTIHSAKGLQFPVVHVPFAWYRHRYADPQVLHLHGDGGERLLDVGGPGGPGWRERRQCHDAEEDGEELRLLYVALTRAQCQAVVWWAPSARNTDSSALHRLLVGDLDVDGQLPGSVPVPPDARVRARASALAAACPSVAVEQVGPVPDDPPRWRPAPQPAATLQAAVFDRRLDTVWRRTSFTSLTRSLHDEPATTAGVSSEPEHPERDDEPDSASAADPGPSDAPGGAVVGDLPSPLAAFPAGTAFGTLVHRVLETVDPGAADLAGELRRQCADAVARRGADLDAAALAAALRPVLDTPLGPLAGGRRLRDVPLCDRLAELDFELALSGGDAPRGSAADLDGVAALVRRHLDRGDALAGLPDRLPASAQLRGYLTGSIDAVLRCRDADGTPRYLVVDYKTNLLAPAEGLSSGHYRPAAMRESMLRSGYGLQALLYAVALHRLLRWRQPGYDPDRHLGGVLYLYVRGMCGPSTPVMDGSPCGVFAWRPPAALVSDLSDLLDSGRWAGSPRGTSGTEGSA